MPTHTGKDKKGCYAQWGGHGKKYYYQCGNEEARKRAVRKANKQGQAAHAHGYTGNQGDKTMKTFQRVTSNIKSVVRHDTMEGKDWIVAPTQMITEGVHNGSDGPIFYPADELAKLPSAWNHMPVVVYHPMVNGMTVSARTPDQLTSRKIGLLMNAKWDGETKKLGAETWLDPDRIAKVDNRVGEAIENNNMMEVSTGLYMSLEKKEGEWNGEHYDAIAHDLQPDHLALLPDQLGACSIADGAGFLRANQDRDLLLNEMSHEETRRLLQSAVQETNSNAWIEEVHDSYFIYEDDGKLYKQQYTVDDDIVSFVGLHKLVQRVVSYVDVTGLAENRNKKKLKGQNMDKEKIVDALIKNERTSWTEDHRESLMDLDDTILANMSKDVEELSKPVKTEPEPKAPQTNRQEEQEVKDQKEAPVENVEKKPETVEEYIAKAPPEIRESLKMSVNAMNAEKSRLIKAIMTNEANDFTEEHLKTMDLQMLQAIARLAVPAAEDGGKSRTIPLYIGQGEPSTTNQQMPEPLPLPTMNFGEKEAKTA